jgi:hypothetical protein
VSLLLVLATRLLQFDPTSLVPSFGVRISISHTDQPNKALFLR